MAQELLNFLFGANGEYNGDGNWTLLVFSIASGCIGLIVVFLDFLVVKATQRNSLLKLSYSGFRGVSVFFFWGIGACLGAYVGGAVGIFELNRVASVFVAVSWTAVLPRVLNSIDDNNSTEKVVR